MYEKSAEADLEFKSAAMEGTEHFPAATISSNRAWDNVAAVSRDHRDRHEAKVWVQRGNLYIYVGLLLYDDEKKNTSEQGLVAITEVIDGVAKELEA